MGNVCGGAEQAQIKIYAIPLSTNALGPIILVRDLGVGDMTFLDLMTGAHLKPEFLALNPFHQIPTMESPTGVVLGESVAILRYVAITKCKALYDTDDPKTCARIDWAMDAMATTVYNKWADVTYPLWGFPREIEESEKPKKAADLKRALEMFTDTFLQPDKKFICGDKLTIADYKVAPFLLCIRIECIKKKGGVSLSPRLETYCAEFLAASMTAATGMKDIEGFSAQTTADKKDATWSEVTSDSTGCKPFQTGAAAPKDGKIKIYGMPVSANAVGPALLAKDLECGDMEFLDLMKGEHLKPDYVGKFPFHQIPAYEASDGFVLSESNCMMRHMALAYGPHLYPADVEARAKIDWAMDCISTTLYQKLSPVFYPPMGFTSPPKDQEKVNKECLIYIEMFEKTFFKPGMPFIGGDKMCIADYKLIPFYTAASTPMCEKKANFFTPPSIKKYVTDCKAAMKNSDLLSSADGYSIEEYCKSKE